MSAYTQVLEFFMENGIQLTTDQMNELKNICESGGALNKLLDNRIDKYNKLVRKGNEKSEIGTPQRKKEAEELYDKAKEIDRAPISDKEVRVADGYTTRPTTSDAQWYRENRDKVRKGNENSNIRFNAHAMKQAIGQGKENIPEERKPGEYLKKQELINKYEKGEK